MNNVVLPFDVHEQLQKPSAKMSLSEMCHWGVPLGFAGAAMTSVAVETMITGTSMVTLCSLVAFLCSKPITTMRKWEDGLYAWVKRKCARKESEDIKDCLSRLSFVLDKVRPSLRPFVVELIEQVDTKQNHKHVGRVLGSWMHHANLESDYIKWLFKHASICRDVQPVQDVQDIEVVCSATLTCANGLITGSYVPILYTKPLITGSFAGTWVTSNSFTSAGVERNQRLPKEEEVEPETDSKQNIRSRKETVRLVFEDHHPIQQKDVEILPHDPPPIEIGAEAREHLHNVYYSAL